MNQMPNDNNICNTSDDKIEIEVNINNDEDIILARQKGKTCCSKNWIWYARPNEDSNCCIRNC